MEDKQQYAKSFIKKHVRTNNHTYKDLIIILLYKTAKKVNNDLSLEELKDNQKVEKIIEDVLWQEINNNDPKSSYVGTCYSILGRINHKEYDDLYNDFMETIYSLALEEKEQETVNKTKQQEHEVQEEQYAKTSNSSADEEFKIATQTKQELSEKERRAKMKRNKNNKNELQLGLFDTILSNDSQQQGEEYGKDTNNAHKQVQASTFATRDSKVLGKFGRQGALHTPSEERPPYNSTKTDILDGRDNRQEIDITIAGGKESGRHVSFGTKEELISFCQERRYSSSTTSIARLKYLKERDLEPSFDDLKDLSSYQAYGNLAKIFIDEKHQEERDFLKSVTTEEEYLSLINSTADSFYTPENVTNALYSALDKFKKFKDRKYSVLEPACGGGAFLNASRGKDNITAVELNPITAQITQVLYPNVDIQNKGFQDVVLNKKHDFVVSNFPFGKQNIYDKSCSLASSHKLHDFFLLKSLENLQEGGVLIAITSTNFFNQKNSVVREKVAKNAQLLGAIRLPDNTYKTTNALSDIVVFKKESNRELDLSGKDEWVNTPLFTFNSKYNDEQNENFFVKALGEKQLVKNQFGKTVCNVKGSKEQDLEQELKVIFEENLKVKEEDKVISSYLEDEENRKEYLRNTDEYKEFKKIIETAKAVYSLREKGLPFESKVKELNELYDNSINTPLHDKVNYEYLSVLDEEEGNFLLNLEDYDSKTRTATKTAVFSLKNVVVKHDSFENIEDAMFTSISSKGHIDLHYISNMYQVHDESKHLSKEEVAEYLEDNDLAYYDFKSDEFVIKPKFIKGNVAVQIEELEQRLDYYENYNVFALDMDLMPYDKEKVVNALKNNSMIEFNASKDAYVMKSSASEVYDFIKEEHGKSFFINTNDFNNLLNFLEDYIAKETEIKEFLDDDFNKLKHMKTTLEAFKRAKPRDIEIGDINFNLASSFIPASIKVKFAQENFSNIGYFNELLYSDALQEFSIDKQIKSEKYVSAGVSSKKMLLSALNNKSINVYKDEEYKDKDGDVKTRKAVDSGKTQQANAVLELLNNDFISYVKNDKYISKDVEKSYNKAFNYLTSSYDGQKLKFTHSPLITLRPFQKDAVMQIRLEQSTLVNHTVGAGKTFTLTTALMEDKKAGLIKKGVVVCPDHLREQWEGEVLKLYPDASIKVANSKNFTKEKRQEFLKDIAHNDYDCVIMSNSQFERIPVSPEFLAKKIFEEQTKINKLIFSMEKEGDKSKNREVKRLKSRVEKLDSSIKKAYDSKKDSGILYFDNLGIDALYVDEAHEYKNLAFTTSVSVKGINSTGSARAMDMYIKTQYLHNKKAKIVFATGTPVSNSLAECFTMQRFLSPKSLEQSGVETFDKWANVFALKERKVELGVAGRYTSVDAIVSFRNLQELSKMYGCFTDTILTEDLQQVVNIPELKNGKENIRVEPTSGQIAFNQKIIGRAERIRAGGVSSAEDNILKISTEARHSALDSRTLDKYAEEGNKVKELVYNILQNYHETDDLKGTQLIFSDLSTPKKDGKFSIYNDIRDKLIKGGLKEHEVAFIHDYDTDTKKKELFEKVNKGEVRVLLGSTLKMGTGMNVQQRLVALHHLDAPWRPSDLEQREGRILRQGNKLLEQDPNFKVSIYRYATEKTYDARMWQILENKAKFINDFQKGSFQGREMEDLSGQEIKSIAEMKALASGNPYILAFEKIKQEKQKVAIELKHNKDTEHRYKGVLDEFDSNLKALEDSKLAFNYIKENKKEEGKLEDITGTIQTEKELDEYGNLKTSITAQESLYKGLHFKYEFNKLYVKDDKQDKFLFLESMESLDKSNNMMVEYCSKGRVERDLERIERKTQELVKSKEQAKEFLSSNIVESVSKRLANLETDYTNVYQILSEGDVARTRYNIISKGYDEENKLIDSCFRNKTQKPVAEVSKNKPKDVGMVR